MLIMVDLFMKIVLQVCSLIGELAYKCEQGLGEGIKQSIKIWQRKKVSKSYANFYWNCYCSKNEIKYKGNKIKWWESKVKRERGV